jgi:isoamylase
MISHGDEYGRTQNGNNNVYCQDNELAWMDWDWKEEHKNLFEFTKKIIAYVRNSPSCTRGAISKTGESGEKGFLISAG